MGLAQGSSSYEVGLADGGLASGVSSEDCVSGGPSQKVSVATPAEPRGEKNFFFVQILGGEKLFKIC